MRMQIDEFIKSEILAEEIIADISVAQKQLKMSCDYGFSSASNKA